jgi:hypothetical protein
MRFVCSQREGCLCIDLETGLGRTGGQPGPFHGLFLPFRRSVDIPRICDQSCVATSSRTFLCSRDPTLAVTTAHEPFWWFKRFADIFETTRVAYYSYTCIQITVLLAVLCPYIARKGGYHPLPLNKNIHLHSRLQFIDTMNWMLRFQCFSGQPFVGEPPESHSWSRRWSPSYFLAFLQFHWFPV